MRVVKYSTGMGLAGQNQPRSSRAARGRLDDDGYVLVVLLISMAVTAVWMAAALPSWRQQLIREREAELIFRGESYARAIYLYRQKNGQNLPPNVDVLVGQKFLRKKYKDPITGKDFLAVLAAGARPGGTAAGFAPAGISGVRSTSNDTSIRIYNNQQTYSQWAFDFTLEQLKAGGGVPGAAGPGGRVGPGGPGGPGETAPIPPGGRGPGGLPGGRGGQPPLGGGRGAPPAGGPAPSGGGPGFGAPRGR